MDYYKFILLKKFLVDNYELVGWCIYRCAYRWAGVGGTYAGKWMAVWGDKYKCNKKDVLYQTSFLNKTKSK